MATHDPNWIDEDFDDPSSGFLSTPAPSGADTSVRVPQPPIVPPVPPPASRRDQDHSSVRKTVLLLLLFFITAVGLGIYFFVSPYERSNEETIATGTESNGRIEKPAVEPTPVEPPAAKKTEPTETVPAISEAESRAASVTPPKPSAPKSVYIEKPAANKLAAVTAPKEVAPAPKPAANKRDDVQETPAPAPKKQPATRNTASGDQEWCIQVFASTNADDADEWDARLRSKNIVDSRIEVVDRQGQTWYRVRFGKFKSREDAEQLAMNLGFSNAWINRIR